MPVQLLKEFLDTNKIKYISISHSPAFTAQGIAALTHTPGKELAKTVIVNMDEELAMAVLPASHQVNLSLLRQGARAGAIRLATEREFKHKFPDCETGAMPPFGNLFGLKVFVDEILSQDKEIVFNAGSHRELIRLGYDDFERLVNPQVLSFARLAGAAAA